MCETEQGVFLFFYRLRTGEKGMSITEVLEKVLRLYEAYYDIEKDAPEVPFAAEAVFRSHDEQFFLIQSARLGETESNEYVFFATMDMLTEDYLKKIDKIAWEKGIARVKPHADHRNTDITLIIVSDQVRSDAFKLVPKLSHYKSYRFGFQGWSHYRLVVLEVSSGRVAYNRQGQSLKKLFNNILR